MPKNGLGNTAGKRTLAHSGLSSRQAQGAERQPGRVPLARTSVPPISCYAALDRTACAAFFKESRMEFDNATNLDRKSGVRGMRKTGRSPTIVLVLP